MKTVVLSLFCILTLNACFYENGSKSTVKEESTSSEESSTEKRETLTVQGTEVVNTANARSCDVYLFNQEAVFSVYDDADKFDTKNLLKQKNFCIGKSKSGKALESFFESDRNPFYGNVRLKALGRISDSKPEITIQIPKEEEIYFDHGLLRTSGPIFSDGIVYQYLVDCKEAEFCEE